MIDKPLIQRQFLQILNLILPKNLKLDQELRTLDIFLCYLYNNFYKSLHEESDYAEINLYQEN